MTFVRSLVLACALATSAPAFGVISLSLAPNYDATRTTAFPNGDKPVAGCTPPTGWTEADVGSASGEICEQSATEWDLTGLGNSNNTGNHFAYKDAGGGDIEFIARITDTYSGSLETTAALGIGVRESAAQSSWQAHCHSLRSGSTSVRCTYGDNSGGFTNVSGASGFTRPRYVCIDFHASTDEVVGSESADGSSWSEIFRVERNLSDDLAYALVSSGSVVDTLTATLDNIALGSTTTCSDPTDPPVGAPTLDTPIPNQSGTQGVAFSLDVSSNFSNETSYSIAGLQAGTALSFSTSTGVLSGTPDADDVGTYNVTITATNASGSTPDTFSMTITASSVSIFTLTTGGAASRTFDCDNASTGANGASWTSIRKSGTASFPGPGDVLEMNGVEHAPFTIRDCNGTASSPIIIRNDPDDAAPATIKRTATGKSFVLEILNSDNWELTGLGKWSGAPAGKCGVTTGTHAEGRTQCGIDITKTAGVSQPTWYLRIDGTSCTPNCVVEGVHVDAISNTNGTGVCYSLNDHGFNRSANPGVWREGIYFQDNYGEFCGAEGEGFYVGPNDQDGDVPLRDVHFLRNLIDDGGRDCINAKSVYEGDNEAIDNHCYRAGIPQNGTQDWGINLMGDASWTIARNLLVGISNSCIKLQSVGGDDPGGDIDTATPPSIYTIENNMAHNCGGQPTQEGLGAFLFGQGSTDSPSASQIILRNNTVNSAKGGLADIQSGQFSNSEGTCEAVNNIFSSGGTPLLSNCTNGGNNRTDTTAASAYVDADNSDQSGAHNDLHLTSGSPACSAGSSNAPSDDYDGDSRPLEGTREAGADETTSCP